MPDPPQPEIPELMYIHAAAQRLQCSTRHIYQLVQDGKLAAHRLGEKRGLRVTRQSVVDYVASNQVDPEDYLL